MNKLRGNIEKVKSHDGLSLIEVKVGDTLLKSVVISDSSENSYIKEGELVELLFKETELIISTDINPKISLQNQLNCTIESINKGKVLSQVYLSFNEDKISSIITTNSVERLGLSDGKRVIALIKTNEIMISPC
jgi:molybdopterin-binding protein